jgi:putative RNA 2'-phosphotransferase
MKKNSVEISKAISHALRHNPSKYGLILDEEGFVPLDVLVHGLRIAKKQWHDLDGNDILNAISSSDKRRHEIVNGKIRALYGHSCETKISKTAACPPDILFHATSHNVIKNILENGLLPMDRHYVHLSCDIPTAMKVGKRRDRDPVLLQIDSKMAHSEGILFYQGNDSIWMSEYIHPQYISLLRSSDTFDMS